MVTDTAVHYDSLHYHVLSSPAIMHFALRLLHHYHHQTPLPATPLPGDCPLMPIDVSNVSVSSLVGTLTADPQSQMPRGRRARKRERCPWP